MKPAIASGRDPCVAINREGVEEDKWRVMITNPMIQMRLQRAVAVAAIPDSNSTFLPTRRGKKIDP
jgi:hypothetical protein